MNSKIAGTYIHGLFDNPSIARQWLQLIGLGHIDIPSTYGYEGKDKAYELLADHFKRHIDMEKISQILGYGKLV
ncbi:MAG: hypothetical protein P8Y40_13705 [Desulfobacterales bacterium]